jgi:DNA-binding PadR family transcriptional regulator
MNQDELVSGFLLELRRGTLILCVLANLRTAAYGYSLITRLGDSGLTVEANTLYPLLRRLETQGLLGSEWDTGGAKPRKYYKLTAFGAETLAELTRHWHTTTETVNAIVEGKNDEK